MLKSMFNWLKSASPRTRAGRRRLARRTHAVPLARRASCPPRLEALEDRMLLTAGALDLTFGTGGVVTTPFAGAFATVASDVEVQSNGRIVAVGTTDDPATGLSNIALVRYLPDGRLDASFGDGGRVTTDFGGFEFSPRAALQSDGKIVVAATTYDVAHDFAANFTLARYLPDGRLDPSFGNGGLVTTDFGGDDYVGDVAIRPNGRIVVAGSADYDVAVAAYLPDGRLDPSFGDGGKVVTDLGVYDDARGVVIRPDGKIVVGAQHYDASTSTLDFALVQYTAAGSLDTGFGVGGSVITHYGPSSVDNVLTGIGLQADGKVVAVGGAEDFGTFTSEYLVARYTRDGALDTGFGSGGYATASFGGFDVAAAVVIQPNGQIVVAGPHQGNISGFGLARFNRDGSPDAGFGTDGKVTTDLGPFSLNFGVALQADGQIVTAGFTYNEESSTLDLAVARYDGHEGLRLSHAEADYKMTDLLFALMTTTRKRPRLPL